MRVNDLKQFVDHIVTLHMSDGEIVKVRVNSVDDEDEEIVGTVIESSRPERYRGPCAMHTFTAREIVNLDFVKGPPV